MDGNDLARYKRRCKLGEGTYGLVYKAHDTVEDTIVAMKKIKLLDNNEEGIPPTTLREISLLKTLKHPNIVEMSGVLYDEGELYLIFEFMDCDLRGWLDNLEEDQFIDSKTLKRFTYFLTEGIRYCHSHRILHRDLKPQNILVSKDLMIKIADFGLGKEHGLPIVELTHEVVTLWYRPPEILLGTKTYSGACDVWSIGCIMAEMVTKDPLFVGNAEIDQIFQIYKILGTPNTDTWPELESLPDAPHGPQWTKKDLGEELDHRLDEDGLDLLEQTLCYSSKSRITAKKMLAHRWFDEIREEMIDLFGYQYPHCGSEQWQKDRIQRLKRERKEEANGIDRDQKQDSDLDTPSRLCLDGLFENGGDTDCDCGAQKMSADDESNGNKESDGEEDDDGDDITFNAENIDSWDTREPDRYDNRYSLPMEEDDDEEE